MGYFEECAEEYDNEICCRNCAYFVYDSFHRKVSGNPHPCGRGGMRH